MWLFLSFTVFLSVDTYLHTRGMNTFFWSFKTPEEKEIQKEIIERLRHENSSRQNIYKR